MIEEQCSLANKIIAGVITVQEAEALLSKHITITSQQQSYDHCMEMKNIDGNISSVVSEQYYCFNTEEQILDRVMITSGSNIEVLEHV